MTRRLVATIACRNQGSRLYGKPLQNLDVDAGITILDNILACIESIDCIDEVVLGISEGVENQVFVNLAEQRNIRYVIGDQVNVLGRLVDCGKLANASDIFRITSESPFLYFEAVEDLWSTHQRMGNDATFLDDVVDGCGFEIVRQQAMEESLINGEDRHCSELCTLYIRENNTRFKLHKAEPPAALVRKDLRLTVDNPEDLVVCRIAYKQFQSLAPRIPVINIVEFLDQNPGLVELIAPFAEQGYETMYRWGSDE